MFDYVRKNNKLLTGLMMLFIIPSFVFGGFEVYRRISGPGNGVASIDGQPISQQEWDEAHRHDVAQIRASQPDADAAMLDSPYVRYAALERLIEQRLIAAAIQKFHMQVSDQSVAQALMQIPEIAALRGADGKMDEAKYRQLLRENNKTPEDFEAFVRTQLSQQQILQGISASMGWQPAVLSQEVLRPLLEQREVQVSLFKAADYVSQVSSTEADVQAWFKQHAKQYVAPEQAQIEYLLLDEAAINKRHPHTEQDVKAWYQQNSAHYSQPETRRASHILILADEAADKATLDAAKAKAQALLTEVKAKPESFAALAKKNSQDPGSAAQGGDLGFFIREKMVKPFADAAFALKKGEISEIVQSKYGFHIIQLQDIKPANTPAFETVKARVTQDYQQEQSNLHFANDTRALAEEVSKNPLSLKAAAEKLGLSLQSANGISRQPAANAQDVLSHPKLLKALFAAQSLDKKHATEVLTLAPNLIAVGRVVAYTPERAKMYDEVKSQLAQDYVQAKAAELAQAAGAAQLKQWAANPQQAQMPAPVLVSKAQPAGQPQAVVSAAMHANRGKLPAFEGVNIAGQGYAIVRVNKVLEPDAAAAAIQAQQVPAVQQALMQAQSLAYLESLKKVLNVKINVPAPAFPAKTDAMQ